MTVPTGPLIIAELAASFPKAATHPTLVSDQLKIASSVGTAADVNFAAVMAALSALTSVVSVLGGKVSSLQASVAKLQGAANPTGTPQTVGSIVITPSPATVMVGETVQLVAKVIDKNGITIGNPVITWTALEPNTATIDSTGLITGVAVGIADMHIDTDLTDSTGASISASTLVNVIPNPNIPVVPTPTPTPTPIPTATPIPTPTPPVPTPTPPTPTLAT